MLNGSELARQEHVRGGGDLVVGVGGDADTGCGQLIVVDFAEDISFRLLGVEPSHIIQLASQHEVVVVCCHLGIIILSVPANMYTCSLITQNLHCVTSGMECPTDSVHRHSKGKHVVIMLGVPWVQPLSGCCCTCLFYQEHTMYLQKELVLVERHIGRGGIPGPLAAAVLVQSAWTSKGNIIEAAFKLHIRMRNFTFLNINIRMTYSITFLFCKS